MLHISCCMLHVHVDNPLFTYREAGYILSVLFENKKVVTRSRYYSLII